MHYSVGVVTDQNNLQLQIKHESILGLFAAYTD